MTVVCYNIFIAGRQGISRELSLHPVHLTPEDNLPPSALVPFCTYQGESKLLGQEMPELGGLHRCDKFEPTLLEGQLCYSLNVKLRAKLTRSGKSKGLFLLLDPNPYRLNISDKLIWGPTKTRFSSKIFIQTLEPFTTYGPGSYRMSTLKKMTGTQNFMELPDHRKKCSADDNREECQNLRYLDQVQRECKCVPWVASIAHMMDKGQVRKQTFNRPFNAFRI